jgi:hypothetical protein
MLGCLSCECCGRSSCTRMPRRCCSRKARVLGTLHSWPWPQRYSWCWTGQAKNCKVTQGTGFEAGLVCTVLVVRLLLAATERAIVGCCQQPVIGAVQGAFRELDYCSQPRNGPHQILVPLPPAHIRLGGPDARSRPFHPHVHHQAGGSHSMYPTMCCHTSVCARSSYIGRTGQRGAHRAAAKPRISVLVESVAHDLLMRRLVTATMLSSNVLRTSAHCQRFKVSPCFRRQARGIR